MSNTPLTDHMRKTGSWNEAWDEFAELDPVWTEKFMDMGTLPMRSGVLDRKTIELLFLAVNVSCTHMYAPGVRRHIRGALAQGASKEEIMAVLQLVAAIGIQSCSLGAPILKEELAAHANGADRKAT
jgi:alkylhydroperoxidase/carboxymuconolactone decarboxylase family protein YurZ